MMKLDVLSSCTDSWRIDQLSLVRIETVSFEPPTLLHILLPSCDRETHESDMLSRRSCIQNREYQYWRRGILSEMLTTW